MIFSFLQGKSDFPAAVAVPNGVVQQNGGELLELHAVSAYKDVFGNIAVFPFSAVFSQKSFFVESP